MVVLLSTMAELLLFSVAAEVCGRRVCRGGKSAWVMPVEVEGVGAGGAVGARSAMGVGEVIFLLLGCCVGVFLPVRAWTIFSLVGHPLNEAGCFPAQFAHFGGPSRLHVLERCGPAHFTHLGARLHCLEPCPNL